MPKHDADIWVDQNAEQCGTVAHTTFNELSSQAHSSERLTRYFALPEIALTVEIVGSELGQLLTAAFRHLERDAPVQNGTQLTWRIGDASLLGAFPDFPPLNRSMHELGNFNTSPDGRFLVERRSGVVSVQDQRTQIVTSICESGTNLENDHIAKPLLRFLMGLLQKKGIHLTHAALVGKNGRGMLVTGKGGMGKSTISSVALGNGLSFCSDDFVALQRVGTQVIGHSLYASLLLNPEQISKHPHFKDCARPSNSTTIPKTVVILGQGFCEQTVASLIVDAIAVPNISEHPVSVLQPMSRIEALGALTPTSVFSSPWRSTETARFLLGMAAEMPCFSYISGSNFARISQPLEERYA